jgi:hypothetical protein
MKKENDNFNQCLPAHLLNDNGPGNKKMSSTSKIKKIRANNNSLH